MRVVRQGMVHLRLRSLRPGLRVLPRVRRGLGEATEEPQEDVPLCHLLLGGSGTAASESRLRPDRDEAWRIVTVLSHRNLRVGGGHSFSNRAKGSRGVPPETIVQIESFVRKYLEILGATHLPRPQLEFRSNIGSRWLAADGWSTADPSNTTLVVQKAVLGDLRTLERVIAHEIVHHVDFMSMTEQDVGLIQMGLGRSVESLRDGGHGPPFLEKAARINAVAGDGFVTKTSDAEYVTARNTRPYHLLIVPIYQQRRWTLGWAWTTRLSPEGRGYVEAKVLRDGARLVQSTDDRWLGGARIKRHGGVSVPRDETEFEALRALFVEAAV